jgi:uncharacterized protein (DUF1330 family)
MESHLEPTLASRRDFIARGISDAVVMLNMLRFRKNADYSTSPELAPVAPINGEAAYRLYMQHAGPHLERARGKVLYFGRGGQFLIGPQTELWDAVLLVQYESTEDFLNFTANRDYLKGLGHRTAALEDSRLLPLQRFAW